MPFTIDTELYEERAAILEYEAKFNRAIAEKIAKEEQYQEYIKTLE